MSNIYQDFWEGESDSGQRSLDSEFLEIKSLEHSRLLTDNADNGVSCIDLGIGAGEITRELLRLKVNITEGVDSSGTMLRKRRTL